jgi:2-oxoglutarate dehydrogenase E2 component (dihydrolipoamide succinyltransferase)
MPTQVNMPKLGESIVEGTVARWLKSAGDAVAEFESLLEVETDKVVSEIPSPAGGVLLAILVPDGSTVPVGSTLAWIGHPGEPLPTVADRAVPVPVPAKTASPAPVTDSVGRDLGFISPVVARIARENGLDLQRVPGTGQGGRITKKDVLAFLEARPAPAAQVAIWETPADGDLFRPSEMVFAAQSAPAPAGNGREPHETLLPHTPMRRQIAGHMLDSRRTSPHVTTVMEADLSKIVAHREAHKAAFERDGARLTYTSYFVAAAVAGLKAFPRANSSWREDGLVLHAAVHVGMAVSLGEDGLIVPVIRDADRLSLLGLVHAVDDLSARARARKLQPDEVRGGTFTLTNHGVSGSLLATPIIHQPQCGILGVGLIQKRVVVVGDAIAIRPMVYLSFTFDHRILDGAAADAFLGKVVDTLQTWA